MGRREITGGIWLLLFGTGSAAMIGAAAPSDYQSLLFWGGLAICLVSAAALARLYFTGRAEAKMTGDGKFTQNINTNLGTAIQAETVHIGGERRLDMLSKEGPTQTPEGFLTLFKFDAPNPIPRVAFQAIAKTIKRLNIQQDNGTSMSLRGAVENFPPIEHAGMLIAEQRFGPVHGRYVVIVVTEEPEDVRLAHKLM